MNQINTGNIIRATRLRQNITQRELAGKIGVSDKAVSKWERGCGKRLAPLSPKSPSAEEALRVEHDGNELYITSEHEMTREHHISFAAFLSGDTLVLKKLYPEWNLEMRLPFFAHGKLLRYCNEHGLFIQDV